MAVENKNAKLPTQRIREILHSILQEENLNSEKVNCEIEKIPGGRFVSSMYYVNAYNPGKHVCLYIKCLPEDAEKCDFLSSPLHFQNEIIFYNYILPAFKQLQREKCPQETRSPVSVPQCYAAECNGKDDVVILKDMSINGYVVLDRLKPMGLPEISLVFKELGRLHGFSLALKILHPDKMKEICEKLIEPAFIDRQYEKVVGIFSTCLEDVYEVLKKHHGTENLYLKKYELFIRNVFKILPELAPTDPSNEPYNVFTHGDSWVSNYMFHYGENESNPDDVCILDFQQVRYNSPAVDLGRFLYVSMDKATRQKHRNSLLRCYHNSLSQTLKEFGMDSDYIFPFCVLESQLRKYSSFFVFNAIFNLVHALDTHEAEEGYTSEGADGIAGSIAGAQQRMSAECRRRIFEIIEESVDRNYMDFENNSE